LQKYGHIVSIYDTIATRSFYKPFANTFTFMDDETVVPGTTPEETPAETPAPAAEPAADELAA